MKASLLPHLYQNRQLHKNQEKNLAKLFREITNSSIDDRDEEDWFVIGIVEYRNEEFDEAIDAFDRAIEKNNNYEVAYLFRARCYKMEKSLDQALKDIEKALEVDATFADALYEKAEIVYLQENFDNAISIAKEILEADPEHPDAKGLMAKAYYDKDDFDESISIYSEIIEEEPKNAEAIASRGLARFFKGDYNNALSDIKKARMLEPGGIVGDFNVGLISSMIPEKSKEAYRHFEKAFKKDSNLLKHYAEHASARENDRLNKKLKEILDGLETRKDENFYTRELYFLLERKMVSA